MYYVYVLVNGKNNETYIGSTNDLKRRLKEHNKGLVYSTKKYMPWKLKYYESFDEENLARVREQKLKHNGNARKELLKRVGLPSTTLHYAKNGAGFTLIEILLYLVILAMIIGVISSFFYLMHTIDIKAQVATEVENQGNLAANKIIETIKYSEGITSPIVATSTSSLVLDVRDAINDPTIFDVNSGRIAITEGSQATEFLTSNKLNVSNIEFSNVSYLNTPGIVKFEFTINYINETGRNEYDYEKTFYGSATLR